MTIKSLLEKRKDAFAAAEDIKKQAAKEDREMTQEERGKVGEIFDSIDGFTDQIELRERQLKIEREMAGNEVTDDQKRKNDRGEAPAEYREVFTKWFRGEALGEDLTREERAILKQGEQRAQTSLTDSSGGYTVPEGFSGMLEKTMALFGGMLEAGTVWNTASGNPIPYPTVNDTSNVGALLAENTQDSEQDVTFGSVTFNSYKYTSKIVRVPFELLRDSYFNMEQVLADLFGERLGRGINAALTTGTGSSQPNGVVTAASSGLTAAAVAAVTRPELVQLVHSVDPAYRQGPKTGFMFNDSTLSAIKQLGIGASDARPLWQPGMAVGEPNTIDGYRYFINQNVASLAASSKSILFGDFSKYMIRRIGEIRFRKSDDLYFDYDQSAFVALMAIDGDLIASTAIKFITQAAS